MYLLGVAAVELLGVAAVELLLVLVDGLLSSVVVVMVSDLNHNYIYDLILHTYTIQLLHNLNILHTQYTYVRNRKALQCIA